MDPRPYRSAATRGEPAPHRVDHARAGEGAGRAAAPPSSGGRRAPALPADHENREPLARHLYEEKGAFHLALHDGRLVAPDRAGLLGHLLREVLVELLDGDDAVLVEVGRALEPFHEVVGEDAVPELRQLDGHFGGT